MTERGRPRRNLKLLGWVGGVTAIVMIGLAALVIDQVRRWKAAYDGYFEANQYNWVLSIHASRMVVHMPPSIPANATGVRLYSPGIVGFLPAPDHMMEARWVLPVADAAAIAKQAAIKAAAFTPPASFPSYSSLLENLRTAHDQNLNTPQPAGLTHYLLANPSGMNVYGVSVDAQTGEVIYWFFEF